MSPSKAVFAYRLRTTGALPSALLVLAWHVIVVPQGGTPWRGDFSWAVQVLGKAPLFLAPLLVALAAIPLALRGGTVSAHDLMPVRPVRTVLGTWLFTCVPVILVQAAALGVMLAICVGNGGHVEPTMALSVIHQLVAFSLFAALGLAIVSVWRHPSAVVAAALAGLVLTAYGAGVLRVSAGNMPSAGLRLEQGPQWSGLVVQVAATAILLIVAVVGRRVGRLAGAFPWVVLLAVVGAASALGQPIWTVTGQSPETCSEDGRIEVCVFGGYARMLPSIEEHLGRVEQTLSDAGIETGVRRLEQSVPGRGVGERGTARIAFQPSELDQDEVDASTVVQALMSPVWCERIFDPASAPMGDPERDIFAQAWILHEVGAMGDVDYQSFAGKYAEEPRPQQVGAVREFFDDNQECRNLG